MPNLRDLNQYKSTIATASEIHRTTISKQIIYYLEITCEGLKIEDQEKFIAHSEDRPNFHNAIVVIKGEPFAANHQRLAIALSTIETIASQSPKLLIIETASSLALLCAPVLKSIGDHALLLFSINKANSRKKIETLKSAQALQTIGIPVAIRESTASQKHGVTRTLMEEQLSRLAIQREAA